MKLFVAKLNRDAVESDLLEWFGAMGPVKSAKIVMDRDTGQSKCFGFVEMENREGGEKAIAEMNGQEFMGFRMVVKEAEERGSRPSGSSNNRPSSPSLESSPRSSGPQGQGGHQGRSFNSAGGNFGPDKKFTQKKKASKQKPDKYADGPRQTRMKKTRGGGGSRGWSDLDEDY